MGPWAVDFGLLITDKDLQDIESALKDEPRPYWRTDNQRVARDKEGNALGFMRGSSCFDAEGNYLGWVSAEGEIHIGGNWAMTSGRWIGLLATTGALPAAARIRAEDWPAGDAAAVGQSVEVRLRPDRNGKDSAFAALPDLPAGMDLARELIALGDLRLPAGPETLVRQVYNALGRWRDPAWFPLLRGRLMARQRDPAERRWHIALASAEAARRLQEAGRVRRSTTARLSSGRDRGSIRFEPPLAPDKICQAALRLTLEWDATRPDNPAPIPPRVRLVAPDGIVLWAGEPVLAEDQSPVTWSADISGPLGRFDVPIDRLDVEAPGASPTLRTRARIDVYH